MLWILLILPVITSVILLVKYHKKMVWWEYLILYSIAILLIFGTKAIVLLSKTSDVEYWGNLVSDATYYEDWDEEVPCTHTKYCTRKNSDGETEEYACGTEHIYDVDYHSAHWSATTRSGNIISISGTTYDRIVKRFGNKKFVDLHRNYHLNDGDKYVTTWDRTDEKFFAITTTHHYKNRVQASTSTFNYPKVSNEDVIKYSLFDYPEIFDNEVQNILGYADPIAEERLNFLNGDLGPKKQIRVWILVFKNEDREAGNFQEWYWTGGNKNEFTICIGINNSNEIQWSHVISWTEVQSLKVGVESFIQKQDTLDLVTISDYLYDEVNENFVRKEFSDFNYLKVEPPMWSVILAFILVLLASIGIGIYSVKNQFENNF